MWLTVKELLEEFDAHKAFVSPPDLALANYLLGEHQLKVFRQSFGVRNSNACTPIGNVPEHAPDEGRIVVDAEPRCVPDQAAWLATEIGYAAEHHVHHRNKHIGGQLNLKVHKEELIFGAVPPETFCKSDFEN